VIFFGFQVSQVLFAAFAVIVTVSVSGADRSAAGRRVAEAARTADQIAGDFHMVLEAASQSLRRPTREPAAQARPATEAARRDAAISRSYAVVVEAHAKEFQG
jgi:hypothetical protein